MMLLIMYVMMSVVKPLTASMAPRQVRKVEEVKAVEGAKT